MKPTNYNEIKKYVFDSLSNGSLMMTNKIEDINRIDISEYDDSYFYSISFKVESQYYGLVHHGSINKQIFNKDIRKQKLKKLCLVKEIK